MIAKVKRVVRRRIIQKPLTKASVWVAIVSIALEATTIMADPMFTQWLPANWQAYAFVAFLASRLIIFVQNSAK